MSGNKEGMGKRRAPRLVEGSKENFNAEEVPLWAMLLFWGLVGGLSFSLFTVYSLLKIGVNLLLTGRPFPKSTHGVLFDLLCVPLVGFAAGVAACLARRLTPGPAWLKDAMTGIVAAETIMGSANLREPNSIDQFAFLFMGLIGACIGPWVGESVRNPK